MFMKHYVPNRCEPRIEVNVKMGVRSWGRGGGCQGDVNKELKLLVKMKKVWWEGIQSGGGGGGVGVDVNKQLKN